MKQFNFQKTFIEGLCIVERTPVFDQRDFFEKVFCKESFDEMLGNREIRQINHSLTSKLGTVRGLHFQFPPHSETKVVSCLKGKVWDVAVDLRKGSPTFLKHHAVILSEGVPRSYLIPEGFAHGFQALTIDCELLYFHTSSYCAQSEGGLNALDPVLSIDWPLAILERSERDRHFSMLTSDFRGI